MELIASLIVSLVASDTAANSWKRDLTVSVLSKLTRPYGPAEWAVLAG